MKNLQNYHLIWLQNNSTLTEEWLRTKLKEGFDIHHIDGNHFNDSFDNLVLIYHPDHMRLHGMNFSLNRITYAALSKEDKDKLKEAKKERKASRKLKNKKQHNKF